MYCPNCKQEFPGKFCPECGTKLVEVPKQNDFGVNISDDAAIMGGVNVTRNESHNTTNYDHRVITNQNVTNIVERQKTDAELRNERNIKFMELCKEVFKDGLLDEEEKRMLTTERIRLGIDETEAARLIEMARKSSMSRMTTLSMRDSMTLSTIDNFIKANKTEVLVSQIPRLAALARNYKVDEVLYRYYMLLAALQPEGLISEYETNVADEYWKTYWAAIAYMKTGDTLNAEDAIVKLDLYPEYSEDNSLLLSAVSTLREFGAESAEGYISAILPEHCSSLLMPFIHALFLEASPERAAEIGADKRYCQFYIDNLVNMDSPEEKASKAAYKKGKEYYYLCNYKEAVKWLREAAEQGHTEAQLKLGKCYYNGEGVEEDRDEAEKWLSKAMDEYHKAAKNGDSDAQYELGDCYFDGCGIATNEDEAIKWWRKAAEQGQADALYELGMCYTEGFGVEKDSDEAEKWLRKAMDEYHKTAENGNAHAQYRLGDCYSNGYGTVINEVETVKWWRKAAEQGHIEAQYELGECYFLGLGIGEDLDEAVYWTRKAAEQEHEEAQNNLAAYNKYIRGADESSTEALTSLFIYKCGVRYADNFNDIKALKWWRKVAEQGHPEAQYRLGDCYFNGCGIATNEDEGIKWWRKAAEQGHTESQYILGRAYNEGWVDKDDTEAVKWWRKAAEQGYKEAFEKLGDCYNNGWGVDRDHVKAKEWYKKASSPAAPDTDPLLLTAVQKKIIEIERELSDAESQSKIEAKHELTEECYFDVILKSAGANTLQIVKVLMATLDIGLREAKDLIDAAPDTIKKGIYKADAEALKKELEENGATVELVEEYYFDVILKSAGDNTLQIVKILMATLDIGLREAKDLIDAAPVTLKEGIYKADAEALKKELEENGATVELKADLSIRRHIGK